MSSVIVPSKFLFFVRPKFLLLTLPTTQLGLFCTKLRFLRYRVLFQYLSSCFRMTEPPFVPRERILKQQQYFQNIHKHTYLKGRYDKITSVAIPVALAVTALAMIGRGIYNMSHGIGKKE
ncbi:uncharacterized protein LOC143883594 [Tasmannia lanceolata]|uniref:uncharacterized protein LOC143883594 n=1 Tax=Tasmannia lanceolata TaxID=3420 RepID=UPI0040648C39